MYENFAARQDAELEDIETQRLLPREREFQNWPRYCAAGQRTCARRAGRVNARKPACGQRAKEAQPDAESK
jgi:hypothetical protein